MISLNSPTRGICVSIPFEKFHGIFIVDCSGIILDEMFGVKLVKSKIVRNMGRGPGGKITDS
jgi:hypothetical protein